MSGALRVRPPDPDRQPVSLHSPGGSNAWLEVRFAPAFLLLLPTVWGDRWIVRLADDDGYAVKNAPPMR